MIIGKKLKNKNQLTNPPWNIAYENKIANNINTKAKRENV